MVEGFGGLGPKFEALYAAAEGPLTRVMQLAAVSYTHLTLPTSDLV